MLAHAIYPTRFGTRLVDQVKGQSTADVVAYDPLHTFSMVVTPLFGCTSVILVSRLGVFMSHHWEDRQLPYAFSDMHETIADLDIASFFSAERFEEDVMQHLPNGGPDKLTMPSLLDLRREGQILGADGPGGWSGLEGGNRVKAIIVTPRFEEPPYGLRFPLFIHLLQEAVSGWFPEGETEVVTYPQSPAPEAQHKHNHFKTARGKVLFEYDPKQENLPYTNEDGEECDEWWSAVRVFVGEQEEPVYDDEWTMPTAGAFAPRGRGPGLQANQLEDSDDAPACRQQPVLCAANICRGCDPISAAPETAVSKRQDLNSTLVRRAFEDPYAHVGNDNDATDPSGFAGFMLSYYYERRKVEFVLHNDQGEGALDGISSATVKRFVDVEQEDPRYNLMVEGLYGCTSLVIISRLGIYLSHLYDLPGFTEWRGGKLDGVWYDPYPSMFDEHVMQNIPYGRSRPGDAQPMPALLDFSNSPRGIFKTKDSAQWTHMSAGNSVKAFIVTPRNWLDDPRDEIRYPQLVDRLRDAVKIWVPNSNPEIVGYKQDTDRRHSTDEDRKRQRWFSAHGKILIEFDAKNRVDKIPREGGGECDLWFSSVRMFVGEDTGAPL